MSPKKNNPQEKPYKTPPAIAEALEKIKGKKICTCGRTKTPPYCDHAHDHEHEDNKHDHEHDHEHEDNKHDHEHDHEHEHGEHEPEHEREHDREHEHHQEIESSLLGQEAGNQPAFPQHPPVVPPEDRKILLMMLPFWSPLIPPQGISYLKHFLEKHGYEVRTVDANTEIQFKEIQETYMTTLKMFIPEDKLGNIYNIGNEVMRDHMMAHINQSNENRYRGLVKEIIYQTFFHRLTDLQAKGMSNIIMALYLRLKEFVTAYLESEKPAVFGLSVFRDNLGPSLFAFRLCKRYNPHIKTVMGGSVFTIHLTPGSPNMEYFMERTRFDIDKVIMGRGEVPFLNYLRSLRRLQIDDGAPAPVFVPGSPDDQPDFSDFDLQRYQYQGALGSIGCPYECSFCNAKTYYGQYRKKDPAQLTREMTALHRQHGSRLFFMLDELLNPLIDDLASEFIKQKVELYYDAYFRVDEAACDIENTLKWRKGGFYRARLGIESGSQRILDRMNKKITVQQIRQNLQALANAGIKTTTYVVIGHPGETEEDFQMTLDLITELKDYIWEAECNPFTYFYSGQSHSPSWADNRKLLFPQWASEMLMTQTWIVEPPPSREVLFQRINRFVKHCKQLSVSTPWTLNDVNKADERWKKIHKNAVPAILELSTEEFLAIERSQVKKYISADDLFKDEGGFDFNKIYDFKN